MPALPRPAVADEPVSDQTNDQRIRARYVRQMNELVAHANANTSMEILVDILTWTVARAIVYLDQASITGDVLRRLGQHIGTLAAERDAQRELREAREKGVPPN